MTSNLKTCVLVCTVGNMKNSKINIKTKLNISLASPKLEEKLLSIVSAS